MEIRKYQHACLVLTKNNQSLVVDPGSWSHDFDVPQNVVGVVVTHEHADHFDIAKLHEIVQAHPEINIFAHVDVVAQLGDLAGQGVAVAAGDSRGVGEFQLRFTGGKHAVISPGVSVCANLGLVVDDGALYYPGDSFTLPGCPVHTLAVPDAAPWLKVSEAMRFVTNVQPKRCFPTHDAVLSPEGRSVFNAWLEKAATSAGAVFTTDTQLRW